MIFRVSGVRNVPILMPIIVTLVALIPLGFMEPPWELRDAHNAMLYFIIGAAWLAWACFNFL